MNTESEYRAVIIQTLPLFILVRTLALHSILSNGHLYKEDKKQEACCRYFCKHFETWRRANETIISWKIRGEIVDRLPPEVLLFLFWTGRNVGNLLTVGSIHQFLVYHQGRKCTGNRVVNGKSNLSRLDCCFWKTLTNAVEPLLSGHILNCRPY